MLYGDLVPTLRMGDTKRYADATERNREPILEVLRARLPESGRALEVASGTGQHAVFFAQRFPQLTWQPSDIDETALASIRGWITAANLPNLLPPIQLDATQATWQVDTVDVLLNINMIHISPWAACQGLLRNAASILGAGKLLYLYGPYNVNGAYTAPSNARFDQWLRSQDPAWGIRDVKAVADEAEKNGFVLEETVPMPANNLSVIFRKEPGRSA